MKIYALYYYDRPLLAPWLSHYCQFNCIEEIVIQDQNWSKADTSFLHEVVEKYVAEYDKKIVVLPSPFKRIESEYKRAQFAHYGQPTIRNMVIKHFQNDVWIMGSMDEAIYGESYQDTENKLSEFENFAKSRAEKGIHTVGWLPLYSVFKNGIFPSGHSLAKQKIPVKKNRIYRIIPPFAHRGGKVHDNSINIFRKGKWSTRIVDISPGGDLRKWAQRARAPSSISFVPELKIVHYHTLIRPSLESAAFLPVSINQIENPEKHPKEYLNRLAVNPWR